MLGDDLFQHYPNFVPLHDSLSGDLSSECSSSISYGGAQSPPAAPPISYVFTSTSTDHFQGVQQYYNDECPNSIIQSMNRATPYSPHEKKERILRYRSKRNLRNFNKKIKYECRKTLADRRPRVRGRFAKNVDETIAKSAAAAAPLTDLWDQGNYNDVQDYNWIDAFIMSTNFIL